MVCAIYARVSTEDQDCEIQLTNLRAFAKRWEWDAIEYVEKLSGKEGGKRPELDRLLADVAMKKIDVVLVWKMDRFGRSTLDTLTNIKTLDSNQVRFLCPTMNIDTGDNSPTGRFTLTMFAAIAELERSFILERTSAGFKAYRESYATGRIGKTRHSKSGKDLPVGRPKRVFDRSKAVALREAGHTIESIARTLSIGRGTAQRLLSAQNVG